MASKVQDAQNDDSSSGGKFGSQKHERSPHHTVSKANRPAVVEAVVVEDITVEESLRAVHLKLNALQLQVAAVGTEVFLTPIKTLAGGAALSFAWTKFFSNPSK